MCGIRMMAVPVIRLAVVVSLASTAFGAAGEGTAGDLGSVIMGTGVPVAIFGLFFALMWDRYRSLPVLIAFHWGVDVLPTTISMLGIDY